MLCLGFLDGAPVCIDIKSFIDFVDKIHSHLYRHKINSSAILTQ